MSEKTGKTPTPADSSARRGNADDTTVKQRVLSDQGLSLESTQRMQRRLQQGADQQLSRRQPAQVAPQVKRPPIPEAPPQRQSVRPPQSVKPTPAPSASPAKAHIKHDSRGNAIWNWAASVGAAAIESTSRLLKRLEAPELSLDDKPRELELEERKTGGYDPYNQDKRGRS
jgi:hypothetical protein